jgi:hypothetical protein
MPGHALLDATVHACRGGGFCEATITLQQVLVNVEVLVTRLISQGAEHGYNAILTHQSEIGSMVPAILKTATLEDKSLFADGRNTT